MSSIVRLKEIGFSLFIIGLGRFGCGPGVENLERSMG